jgi:SAM-dependent methyltransferase
MSNAQSTTFAAVYWVAMRPILTSGMAARALFAFSFMLAAPALLLGQAPVRTPDIFFNPTRHAIADAMLQLAGVTAQDVVYDLGSGDGRIPIIAAQKYGARGLGIEINPSLVTQSWRNANDAEVANRVKFTVGDFFEADLTEATVVTMYLSPSIMKRLIPKLRALKPGTRLVSHQFDMPGWPPDERRQVDEAEILLWRVPK